MTQVWQSVYFQYVNHWMLQCLKHIIQSLCLKRVASIIGGIIRHYGRLVNTGFVAKYTQEVIGYRLVMEHIHIIGIIQGKESL